MDGTLRAPGGRPSLGRLIGALRRADGFLLLSGLLLADGALVGVHTLHKLSPLFADAAFGLDTEWGFAELFQYAKFAALVLMLGAVWARTRETIYGTWMLLFAYMLGDDALQVHERIGALIAGDWQFRPAVGLRPQDFGELAVSAVFGLALASLIALMYGRSGRLARTDTRTLVRLIAALGFFGVGMDMAHEIVDGSIRYLGGFVGIIEDGGEMVVASVLCWYVATLVAHRRAAEDGDVGVPRGSALHPAH